MSSFVKRTKETLPSARSGHVLLNDNKNQCIYVLGGYNDNGPLDDIYRYDYKINKWTKLITTSTSSSKIIATPLPRLECDCCLISAGDNTNIYLFGGIQNIDDQVLIYNDLWYYNTNKLSWLCIAEETPISERSGHVLLSISNNNFIVHGGECLGRWFDDTWLYDIKQKKWMLIAINGRKPIPRSSHSIVYCEDSNIIALFGGITSSSIQQEMVHLNDLWILDMKTNNDPREWIWQMLTFPGLCPSPRDLAALMSLGNGKIMIMGGYGLEEIDIEEVDENAEGNDINMNIVENEDETEGVDNENNNNDIDDSDNDYEDMDDDDDDDDDDEDQGTSEEIIEDDSSKLEKANVDDLNMNGMIISSSVNENVIGESNEEEEEDDDDDDNDNDGIVEVTYLDDCWILDLNTITSVEVELGECITNGKAIIPRRGMKMTRIIDDNRDTIITFGGFDGSSFYGSNECIDTKKLLLS
jgi:hypothetical protein